MTHLLERHHHCQRVNQGQRSQSKAFVAYCSNNTELQNAFVSQPPQLLAVQTLVMAVDADGNEIGQRCDQSLDSPFDPCQGHSEPPLVSLQEQQVTSSDSLRGQSAMPRVSAQQIDSDDEETAFLLQNLLSLTRNTMSESGPRWMKVATPLVTARVGQLMQNDISTCSVFSRSIASSPETRFSLDLVATRLPQLDVASFRLHLPSLLNVATSITCQALLSRGSLPGDGPFLFPINAQAKLGLIKDMARSRIFIENKPGFYLRMYKDAKTGLMLMNVADFDLLNDQALTPQLLRASKPMYALGSDNTTSDCLTGGTNASGEHVDILRSLTRLPGNHTLRFTHVAIGLDVMDEYPGTDGLFAATSVSDIADEFVTSLLEIEKIAKCWSRLCVDDSQRRYTKRTSFSLIAVLSEILPAVLCETIGEFIRPRSPRF